MSWPETYLDVVTSIFPDMKDEEEARSMMWNCTAYPFRGNDWAHYQTQLLTLRETLLAGKEPCEWCSEPGTDRGPHLTVCDKCYDSLLFDSDRAAKLEVSLAPREKSSDDQA